MYRIVFSSILSLSCLSICLNTVMATESALEIPKESLNANSTEAAKAVVNAPKVASKVVETLSAEVVADAASKTDLKVFEFVLASQIEAREPKNIVESFARGNERAYVFARLSSVKNTNISFVWYKEGKEYSRLNTTVHAAKTWRTYSSVKLRPGNWKVQLLSGNEVIAEKAFILQ